MWSHIENFAYNSVKNRPFIKDRLKYLYQKIFSAAGKKKQEGVQQLLLRKNTFFGFHDKSPWSRDNKYLLAHRFAGTGNERETAAKPVEIVAFEGKNWIRPRLLGTTRAWNWQQGSQLQWCGNSNRILFNDFVKRECRAVEMDMGGNVVTIHPYPVAALSPDGKAMAAICFNTFGKAMPGYGYDFKGADAHSNVEPDQLVIFDNAGNIELQIKGENLPEIADDVPAPAECFISHVTFSKHGKKVAFMRRYSQLGHRLKSALYVLNRQNQSVTRVPFKDMVSHYCWLNDEEIFAFANMVTGDGFFKYNLRDDAIEDFTDILGSRDGHPHADQSGSSIVFDTYPDRYRIQKLNILDLDTRTVINIAKLFCPMGFWGSKRVDLHPRIRNDSKYICIDCGNSGVRSLATLSLQNKE